MNDPIDITWFVVLTITWLVASLFLTSWMETRHSKASARNWLRFWRDE